MTSQAWVAQKTTPILAKKPNTTAKQLKVDMEKEYPIKLNYTTVWKTKQKAMKELYGDWENTFNDSIITVSVYESDRFSSLKCRTTPIE